MGWVSAMEITFTCPHCGEETLISDEFAGQSGPCRHCGELVTVSEFVTRAISIEAAEHSWSEPPKGSFTHALTHPVEETRDMDVEIMCAPLNYRVKLLGAVVMGMVGLFLLLCLFPLEEGRQASRRMSSGNNLKQIALGIQNYYSTYKQFPRAHWLTPDGKRTLSWRVAIAPFTEHRAIYWRYDANEAWDSDQNKVLADLKEPIYQQPGYSDGDKAFQTFYMVITGPGTLFEEGKDITFDDCTDGLSNTILAVEVLNSGVHWAEPRDLDIRTMIFKINAGGPNGIGAPWKSGANVAFADGSVRTLSKDLLESTLRAMITRNGGEAIESPE